MKRIDSEMEKIIIDLYVNEKLSTTQVALKTGISSTSVSKIIKRNNIHVRSISESKKGVERGTKLPVEQIINMYVIQKKTSDEISNEVGCSKRSVLNILTKNKIKRRKSGWKDDYKNPFEDLILDLYKKGKSINEVSKELDLSYTLVNKILKKNRITRTEKKFFGSIGKAQTIEHRSKIGKTKISKKEQGLYDHIYLKRTGFTYQEFQKRISEFKKYYQKVRYITNKQSLHILKNFDKRGKAGEIGAYHLDHKFSIIEGFKKNINPDIIGNIANLHMIPWEINVMKQGDCCIELEELLRSIT